MYRYLEPFHTGLGLHLAQKILSWTWAEPAVWTGLSSDYHWCAEHTTLFTKRKLPFLHRFFLVTWGQVQWHCVLFRIDNQHRLTASSTGHSCNGYIFWSFMETMCVQWIKVHMSYTCLVNFVLHKKRQRSAGTYISYLPQSVTMGQGQWLQGTRKNW